MAPTAPSTRRSARLAPKAATAITNGRISKMAARKTAKDTTTTTSTTTTTTNATNNNNTTTTTKSTGRGSRASTKTTNSTQPNSNKRKRGTQEVEEGQEEPKKKRGRGAKAVVEESQNDTGAAIEAPVEGTAGREHKKGRGGKAAAAGGAKRSSGGGKRKRKEPAPQEEESEGSTDEAEPNVESSESSEEEEQMEQPARKKRKGGKGMNDALRSKEVEVENEELRLRLSAMEEVLKTLQASSKSAPAQPAADAAQRIEEPPASAPPQAPAPPPASAPPPPPPPPVAPAPPPPTENLNIPGLSDPFLPSSQPNNQAPAPAQVPQTPSAPPVRPPAEAAALEPNPALQPQRHFSFWPPSNTPSFEAAPTFPENDFAAFPDHTPDTEGIIQQHQIGDYVSANFPAHGLTRPMVETFMTWENFIRWQTAPEEAAATVVKGKLSSTQNAILESTHFKRAIFLAFYCVNPLATSEELTHTFRPIFKAVSMEIQKGVGMAAPWTEDVLSAINNKFSRRRSLFLAAAEKHVQRVLMGNAIQEGPQYLIDHNRFLCNHDYYQFPDKMKYHYFTNPSIGQLIYNEVWVSRQYGHIFNTDFEAFMKMFINPPLIVYAYTAVKLSLLRLISGQKIDLNLHRRFHGYLKRLWDQRAAIKAPLGSSMELMVETAKWVTDYFITLAKERVAFHYQVERKYEGARKRTRLFRNPALNTERLEVAPTAEDMKYSGVESMVRGEIANLRRCIRDIRDYSEPDVVQRAISLMQQNFGEKQDTRSMNPKLVAD